MFVAVVEKGGLSQAANLKGISPSMVAKHLAEIEKRLGTRLFNRTTRRQTLTEAGSVYYARSKELLESAQDLDSSVTSLQDGPRGTLRIACPVTLGVHRLTPLITEFLTNFPEVKIDLTLSDRQADLIEEGYDAAIWVGRLENSRYVVRPLEPYAMAMGASSGYLATHGTPQYPQDLEKHNCLGYAYWDRENVWRLAKGGEEFLVPVNGNLRVNNGPALREAAVAGIGIVLQAEVLLQEYFRSGSLVRILAGYSPPSRPKSLLYLPDRRMTPKLRAFIDFLMREMGPTEA